MKEKELRDLILLKLQDRLKRMNMPDKNLKKSTDLVRTGLVNSMEFVELVADLETETGVQLDYEKELEKEGFTTLKGLTDTFQKYLHE